MVSDILDNCTDAVLGHMLVGNYKQCIDDSLGEGMEFVRRNMLPLERIPNLSCSLLGSFFQFMFFHFLPDNDGKGSWKAGLTVRDDLLNENNYNYYPEITVVGWALKKLEGRPLPYPRQFSKQKEFTDFQNAAIAVAQNRNCEIVQHEWADLVKDEENRKLRIADFSGEVRDNHAPTMLNYWHFTIDLYAANDDKNPLKKVSKGWREKMATNLQDLLCNSFCVLNNESQVPRIENEGIWKKR